jgi:hypothetical protein
VHSYPPAPFDEKHGCVEYAPLLLYVYVPYPTPLAVQTTSVLHGYPLITAIETELSAAISQPVGSVI